MTKPSLCNYEPIMDQASFFYWLVGTWPKVERGMHFYVYLFILRNFFVLENSVLVNTHIHYCFKNSFV